MKRIAIFLAGALAIQLSFGLPTPALTRAQILETWGWLIAQQQDLAGIQLSEKERSVFLHGFSRNTRGLPAPCDMRKAFADLEKLAKARREKLVIERTRQNVADAETFFTRLRNNTNVTISASRIGYEILKPGASEHPVRGQTVQVHYVGRLLDGTEFVQMGPFELVLVTNHVSPGLFEGIQQVGRGGALKIYIPPPLPEGDEFRLGVPPGSAIVYELELLDFKNTAPEDLANSLLPPAPEPSPPPPSGYSQTKLIEAWGWNVAQQTPASTFGLNDPDLRALLQGLEAGVQNQPAPVDLARGLPEAQKWVRENKEQIRLAMKRKRLDEMNAFFTRLKKNKHVLETPTGLRCEVLKPGIGPHPRPGQIVVVEYTGRLLDGTVFDRTDNEPLHIQVGLVVPGWNEGIQHVAKGGRIKLYIPPSIGYGDENCSGVISSIPGGSVLLYDIRLLDIQDASTDDPHPAASPK